MVAATHITRLGNQLQLFYEDGSRAIGYPQSAEVWLISSVAGTGGSPGDTTGTPTAANDDYPWPNGNENQISPLGYAYVNCTDFVAWRMNRDVGVVSSPWRWTYGTMRIANGDAIGWKADWQSHGWGVDIEPVAGCIGWHGSEYGSFGHVEYVRAVNSDGSLDMEGYNLLQYGHGKYYHRTLAKSDVASFLSPPRGAA